MSCIPPVAYHILEGGRLARHGCLRPTLSLQEKNPMKAIPIEPAEGCEDEHLLGGGIWTKNEQRHNRAERREKRQEKR